MRAKRAMLIRAMLITMAVIVLFATAPVLSVIAASSFAFVNGCALNEAAAHPCVVAGLDFAGLLYGMFVLGWLGLATLPLGAIALLVWIVAAIVLYIRHRGASASTPS